MNKIMIDTLADRVKSGKMKMIDLPDTFNQPVQDVLDGMKEAIVPKSKIQTFELFRKKSVDEKVNIKDLTSKQRNDLINKMLRDFGYIE